MMGIADVAVRVRERFMVVDMSVWHRQIGAVGMAVLVVLVVNVPVIMVERQMGVNVGVAFAHEQCHPRRP